MPQRQRLELADHWWVSASPRDAIHAATHARWKPGELELAGDPENHPQQISLPGGWQYGVRPLAKGVATLEKKAGADPNFVGDGGAVPADKRLPAHFLTYARRVRVPKSWAGHTIFLHLNKARYHVTVQVNGCDVGHYVGGWEPHRLDVTKVLKPGLNDIVLTIGDVGVSGHQLFDPHNYTGTRLPTCKEIIDNLVHPVSYGGIDGRQVEQVSLEAVPPVRVEYVFANPKVNAGKLCYTVALANDTNKPVRVRVASEAVRTKRLINETVAVPARGTKKITREIAWPDAILWDTDQPHLYDLKTTLRAGGKVLDVHRDYFGFREFTINGHDFLLNGRKIHLFGQSGHVGPVQHAMSLKEKIKFLRIAKEEGHINHVRLHAKPQDRRWVEAADRAGMLITTETALWTTGFYSFDWAGSEEACYQNVRQHFFEALVRRDRNSPSVVIWSLSNEMSPITPWDLTDPVIGPKMSAMTRVFERILAEVVAEDDSRIVQMSSAMDFIGHLRMYNLHYPKNWSAYPDYPHTAYWLDGAFKFPWYGPGCAHVPAWSWRKDKPLYFGEYTCVHGATPDNQAGIVGDLAFEERDYGSAKVQAKLWWMEAQAYRRQDVSGFCAWSFLLGEEPDCRKLLAKPEAANYVHAIRPVAVLNHSYRTDYIVGDEVAISLSVHNDTRHDLELALVCEALHAGKVLATERMPARAFSPGGSVAFTNRFLAVAGKITYRATLTHGDQVVDQWSRQLTVWPRDEVKWPATWFNAWHDWPGKRVELFEIVKAGGCVILDRPPTAVLDDLPVPLRNGKGFAEGDRLEITYAYPRAPFHPVLRGFTAADFALWGADYYVARSCVAIPQEGNVVPLLVAGTDGAGLTSSPLLELRFGSGSFVISMLEMKLDETPVAARLLAALAAYRPEWGTRSAAVSLDAPAWQRLLEVGYDGANVSVAEALAADIAVIDGTRLIDFGGVQTALAAGRTVCLHALDKTQTAGLLRALRLPGEVVDGKAGPREWDIFRHGHPLTNGMTHNYLYWIVDKAKVAPWTVAPTHPEPASALIRLPETAPGAVSLTRRGAVTVYSVGIGTLVIDNLRWHLPDFDEPERPRRFVMTLLTNLGVPLLQGVTKRMGQEFETEAERRERGHF